VDIDQRGHKMKNHIRRIISVVILIAFFGIQVLPAYSFQNLSGWLASDSNPMRETQGDVAKELEPGAIGNGRPLVRLLKEGTDGIKKLEMSDGDYDTATLEKVREGIKLASRIYLSNKTQVPSTHSDRTEKASLELTLLYQSLTEKLFLFNAIVEDGENYLLGFNYEGSIGLSVELVDLLYDVSPELLAQYIFHECVPEHFKSAKQDTGSEVDRTDHRIVYKEIQTPVFGEWKVKELGMIFRHIINNKIDVSIQAVASSTLLAYYHPDGEDKAPATNSVSNMKRTLVELARDSQNPVAQARASSALLIDYEQFGALRTDSIENLQSTLLKLAQNRQNPVAQAISSGAFLECYGRPSFRAPGTDSSTNLHFTLLELAQNRQNPVAQAIASGALLEYYGRPSVSTPRTDSSTRLHFTLLELVENRQNPVAQAIANGALLEYYGRPSVSAHRPDSIISLHLNLLELAQNRQNPVAQAIASGALLEYYGRPSVSAPRTDSITDLRNTLVQLAFNPKNAYKDERKTKEATTKENEIMYRAELFKNNLINTILQNPNKVFGIALDTELGDNGVDKNQNQANEPIWDAIKEVQAMLKTMSHLDGRTFDNNLRVVWGKGSNGQLIREIEKLDDNIHKEDLFMVLKEGNLANFTTYKDTSWITAIDDSILTDLLADEGAYIPIFESITLNIMASQNADPESIKALYDMMSDKPVTLEELNAMLAQRIIRILPKMNYMSLRDLRDENEAIARIYLSA
jgi:hypothetical protein